MRWMYRGSAGWCCHVISVLSRWGECIVAQLADAVMWFLCCLDEVNVSWLSWLMPSLIVWMLNGVVMAAVLAKLFVFGEPVTKPLTASSVSYWRSRRQADVYLAAVSSDCWDIYSLLGVNQILRHTFSLHLSLRTACKVSAVPVIFHLKLCLT